MSTAAPTTHTTASNPPPANLTLLTTFIPPNPTRAWQSAPHPTLPILATCFADKTVRIYSLTCLPPSQPSSSTSTSTSTNPNPPHTSTTTSADPPTDPAAPTTTTTSQPPPPPPPSAALLSTITGGHKRSIRSVAWKPPTSIIKGESVLATGSFDASVGIWRRFETGEYGIRQRRGGSTGASGGHHHHPHHEDDNDDEEEEEEDEEEWNFSVVLDGHESEVKSIAWSVGGNLLATCSRDKSVWIWEEVGSGGEEAEFETVAVLQEHEGDVKTVAWHPEEECLVSGSYDDEVRVWRDEGDDWGCVFRGQGHRGTVWGVAWEGVGGGGLVEEGYGGGGDGGGDGGTVEHGLEDGGETGGEMDRAKRRRVRWRERKEKAGPRFLSCSDDGTVRVWRKVPKDREKQRPMSIIRSRDAGEEWVQETTLPKVHERSIYAVGWSQKSGRVVSCGGDGRVVVYGESWREDDPPAVTAFNGTSAGAIGGGEEEGADTEMHDNDRTSNGKETETDDDLTDVATWKILAKVEAAHGVFEINHVAWARKPKSQQMRGGGNTGEDDGQELIVTTGDDGAVKVWDLDI